MMGERKRRSSSRTLVWVVSGVAALLFLVAGVLVVKQFAADDGQKRQRHIQRITLITPPSPPKIKEKPPEPEIKKEETVKQPEPEKLTETDDQPQDDTPQGDDLGLDADGTGGSDAFGLRAKKGGKALIGGGNGSSQYRWYTQMIVEELQRVVNEILQKNGGIPDKRLQTVVNIVLDDQGTITQYAIVRASGHSGMDNAVREALGQASIGEVPPEGMPRVMRFRISSKG